MHSHVGFVQLGELLEDDQQSCFELADLDLSRGCQPDEVPKQLLVELQTCSMHSLRSAQVLVGAKEEGN